MTRLALAHPARSAPALKRGLEIVGNRWREFAADLVDLKVNPETALDRWGLCYRWKISYQQFEALERHYLPLIRQAERPKVMPAVSVRELPPSDRG